MIRSVNMNDPLFAYLCESQDNKNVTLGFYRFEAADAKDEKMKDKKLKTIVNR